MIFTLSRSNPHFLCCVCNISLFFRIQSGSVLV
nr:MAG TPA: hypothetical protein [Herelleviridae sp.]